MQTLLNKVKTLFYVAYKSMVPTKKYYHDVMKAPTKFSLTYFFFLIFTIVLCVSFSTLFNNGTLLLSSSTMRNDLQMLDEHFSDSLTITIHDGIMTTNHERPYFIWTTQKGTRIPLLVIDERATIETMSSYNTPFLLTNSGVLIRSDGSTELYPYPQDATITITKDTVRSITQALHTLSPLIPFIILLTTILGALLGTFFIAIDKILFLLILAAVTYILFRLASRPVLFTVLFRLGLHGSTAPLIMQGITWGLAITIPLTYWFPLLTTIFFAGTLYEVYFFHPKAVMKAKHRRNT